ncbi:hypothetical protein RBU61_07795 [Tissierella sp. MB52-C2]|uniref:hypothetical protein n=1 Tax=Tissierella sp. MB52-C2 TaxID=3070999 RepID=UPI00280B5F50|nr:hypothetical protein [Tissierella sp. MB52-C2]WMM26566.1 hypothetical protein RBU61_07795 [Tissierella sp. MB52-C2]
MNFKIQKISDKIDKLDVKGQGACDTDCFEEMVWVGKTNGNVKGCYKYEDVYTPKKSTWM